MRLMIALCASLFVVLAVGLIASAGPLTPPAGPVSPTNKTLNEVEPRTPIGPTTTPGNSSASFRIDESGSYYLTGDIEGEPGKDGIRIVASDVTIDLNGFTLKGLAGGETGIAVASPVFERVHIRNGMVRNFQTGVDLVDAKRSTLEGVTCLNNAGPGFTRLGDDARIARCYAIGNEGRGFRASGSGARFVECTARANLSLGFDAGDFAQFDRCLAIDNTGDGVVAGLASRAERTTVTGSGLTGFIMGEGAMVSDCVSRENGADGFDLGERSMARSVVAIGNVGFGVRAANIAHVTGSMVEGNQVGVDATNALVMENLAYENGPVTSGDGFAVSGSYVLHNASRINGTDLRSKFQGFNNALIENFVGMPIDHDADDTVGLEILAVFQAENNTVSAMNFR